MERNDIFTAKLNKGDLIGAIDQSILEADEASKLAKEAIKSIEAKHAEFKALVERTRAKFTLL